MLTWAFAGLIVLTILGMHGIGIKAEGDATAQVSDTTYETFADSLDHCSDGIVMTLLKDVEITTTIYIADKTVMLDLNRRELMFNGTMLGNSVTVGLCL